MKISNLFKKLSKIVLTLALVGGIINTYGKAGEVKAAQTVTETLDFDSMESSSGPGWSWNSGDKVLELNGFNQDVNTTESVPAIELPAGSTIKLIENSTNTIKSPSIGVYGRNITIEGKGSLVIDAETYGIGSGGLEPGLEINGVELQTSNIVCEGPIYINSGIAKVNSILGYALVVGDDGIIEVKNNVEIINIGSNLPDPSNVANAITAKYMAGANESYTSGVTQQLTKNNNATVMTISGKEIENPGNAGGGTETVINPINVQVDWDKVPVLTAGMNKDTTPDLPNDVVAITAEGINEYVDIEWFVQVNGTFLIEEGDDLYEEIMAGLGDEKGQQVIGQFNGSITNCINNYNGWCELGYIWGFYEDYTISTTDSYAIQIKMRAKDGYTFGDDVDNNLESNITVDEIYSDGTAVVLVYEYGQVQTQPDEETVTVKFDVTNFKGDLVYSDGSDNILELPEELKIDIPVGGTVALLSTNAIMKVTTSDSTVIPGEVQIFENGSSLCEIKDIRTPVTITVGNATNPGGSTHNHNALEFEPITTSSGFKDAIASGGNYYLANDIVLTSELLIETDFNLCLNGKVLSINAEDAQIFVGGNTTIYDCDDATPHNFETSESGLWTLDDDGKQTVYGGVITGANVTYGFASGGVFSVGRNSTLNLKGGNIVGNKGNIGAAVYVRSKGTFKMDGGSIMGNEIPEIYTNPYNDAEKYIGYGSAIYLDGGSTFVMNGGTITNNTSGNTNGGAVYVFPYKSTITLSGKPVIKDNLGKNLMLDFGEIELTSLDEIELITEESNLTLPNLITIGSLTSGAEIWVSTGLTPSENNPITFATDATKGDEEYFNPDIAGNYVVYDKTSNTLQLSVTKPTPTTITKIQDTKYEDTGYSVRDYIFQGLDILEPDHKYYFELYKSDEKSIDVLKEEFDGKIGKYYEGQILVANSSAQILWLVNNNNPDLGYSLQFSYFNETNSYDTVVIVDATTREMVDYQIFSLNGSNVNTAPEITDLSIAIGDGKSNIFDELVAGKPLPDVQLSFLAKTDVGDYEIDKYLNTSMGPVYSWSYREKGSSKWMPTFMEPNHTVSESYDYMLVLNVGLITGVDGVFSLAYEKDITNVVTLKNESMLSDYDITAISFVTGAMIAIEPKSNGTEGGETPTEIKVSLNDEGLVTATAEAGIYTSTGSNASDFFTAGTEVALGEPTNFVRVFVYTEDGEELPDGTILKVTAKNATVTELGWTGEGFYCFEVKGIAESTVIYINEEVEDPTDPEVPDPVKPTITTQPTSSLKVEAGSISGSLSVVATGSDLSYQWYKADDANKTTATAISGATSATFDIPKDLAAGTYYYYCTVSLGSESVDTEVTTIVVTAKEEPEDPKPEDPKPEDPKPEEPGDTPEDDNTATDGDLSGKDPVIVYPVRPSKPTTAVGKLDSTTSKVETIINSGTVEEVNKVVEATLATDYLNVEINDNGVKYSATEAEKYSVRIDNLNTVVTSLLTNDEIVQAASGKLNASILLETEVVVIKDIPETTKAMIGDATPVGYQLKETVDISLYKVLGSEKTQIKETSAGIEVTMELPESIRNEKDIKIIRIHNEGTPEEEATVLTSVVNGDGTITFVTDRFSTYAFVTSDMDLSAYSNFGLEVYHNSRVISVENTKNGFDVFGYMWIDYVTPTKNTWREIIFVNTEDASTDKAYRVNANAVYNTFLNTNMYATRDGKVDLSYACYKANVNTNSISSYDKKSTGKMASGTYYAFMRISDGKDSYLFPLVDRVLSDGSTLTLPANFSLSDDLTRTLVYTVK